MHNKHHRALKKYGISCVVRWLRRDITLLSRYTILVSVSQIKCIVKAFNQVSFLHSNTLTAVYHCTIDKTDPFTWRSLHGTVNINSYCQSQRNLQNSAKINLANCSAQTCWHLHDRIKYRLLRCIFTLSNVWLLWWIEKLKLLLVPDNNTDHSSLHPCV